MSVLLSGTVVLTLVFAWILRGALMEDPHLHLEEIQVRTAAAWVVRRWHITATAELVPGIRGRKDDAASALAHHSV
jgi:hypothetical protein